MTSDSIARQLLDDVIRYDQSDAQARAASAQRATHLIDVPLDELTSILTSLLDANPVVLHCADPLLGVIFESLLRRIQSQPKLDHADAFREQLTSLYRHLGGASQSRHLLLSVLLSGDRDDVKSFIELVVEQPPDESKQVLQVFTPLFRRSHVEPTLLFPKLLDGLAHVQLAAPVLDLANYYMRRQLFAEHPAKDRISQLGFLLGELAQRLAKLEEDPHVDAATAAQRSRTVDESVALAVSLCDAMALIGDASVIGKLYQALELKHRRLRTEAAAALAKLGDAHGAEVLVEAAAEPVARLRVLAYAEELGLMDRIAEQHKTAVARAESELSLHLAQPTQLGFPPTECQLVDQRRQFWPSYDDPLECYLFLYVYRLGTKQYSNVGIVGPLTHTLTANLADLPPADIYATFAGWQAEHEQICEWQLSELNESHRVDVRRLERRIAGRDFDQIQPIKLGSFFGEMTLVAKARKGGAEGYVVADDNDLLWHPIGSSPRPFTSTEVYYLYKGRKLLSAFNSS